MWRSVIIYNGERLSVSDEWLVVNMEDGSRKSIPLDDLYCVVIDNQNIVLTIPMMAALAKHKVHLILTDERHLPISQTYPLNTHYQCYRVMKHQLRMTDEFKGAVWKRIVESKISNQAIVLMNSWSKQETVDKVLKLGSEVVDHDKGNREAVVAKMFFRELYGSEFTRFADDKINAVMNYGYSIMRSGVAKSLVAYGFTCVLGVHHISETDEFNLADDFMEPLRPIIDGWISRNLDYVEEGLTKMTKGELVGLINSEVLFDDKRMKLRYAIDLMVKSFVTAVETNNPDRVLLPKVIVHHEK